MRQCGKGVKKAHRSILVFTLGQGILYNLFLFTNWSLLERRA